MSVAKNKKATVAAQVKNQAETNTMTSIPTAGAEEEDHSEQQTTKQQHAVTLLKWPNTTWTSRRLAKTNNETPTRREAMETKWNDEWKSTGSSKMSEDTSPPAHLHDELFLLFFE